MDRWNAELLRALREWREWKRYSWWGDACGVISSSSLSSMLWQLNDEEDEEGEGEEEVVCEENNMGDVFVLFLFFFEWDF